MVFERGASETDDDDGFSAIIYGQAATHALLYLGEDVPAGSMTAEVLGGPQTAGFHVLDVTLGLREEEPDSPFCEDDLDDYTPPLPLAWWCTGGYDRLAPAADDLDTLIPITLGDVQAIILPDHGG